MKSKEEIKKMYLASFNQEEGQFVIGARWALGWVLGDEALIIDPLGQELIKKASSKCAELRRDKE